MLPISAPHKPALRNSMLTSLYVFTLCNMAGYALFLYEIKIGCTDIPYVFRVDAYLIGYSFTTLPSR